MGEGSSRDGGGGREGYMEAAGVHLGVSKALHGILLPIMALYRNLDLLRLQAKQPMLTHNKLGPQVTCLKSLFGQVQSAVFRLWGKELCRLFCKSAEREQKGLQVREQWPKYIAGNMLSAANVKQAS